MMTRERYAHRNMPCGRGRAAYVTGSLCRSPTEMRHATKCRQSEGQPNTRRENRGRAITDMWLDRWKGSQSKVVVKVAPNWRGANVAPRRISISYSKNSPAWAPSAGFIQGARPQSPICRTPWLNSTVGMGAD